jgi:hypothetical protein
VTDPNLGQAAKPAKFVSAGPSYRLFAAPNALVVSTKSAAGQFQEASVRITAVGANPDAEIVGLDKLATRSNYLIGNNPKKWRTNIPGFGKVKYKDLYPGIDWIIYGNPQQLEYDLVIAPGASPESITLGIEGADRLEIDCGGDLVLHAPNGQLRQRKPLIYQESSGLRREISGGYKFKGTSCVGFDVAAYDASLPLVIDPVLVYSTYLGGSGYELDRYIAHIAVDSTGNAYLTGSTASADFPLEKPLQKKIGGNTDAFVAKLDSTGSRRGGPVLCTRLTLAEAVSIMG